jgi:hypothetical protein
MCNSKESTPYEHCVKAFENSVATCRYNFIKNQRPTYAATYNFSIFSREKLGVFASFCELNYLTKMFCYAFKAIDVFCEMIDFMSDSVLQDIERSRYILIASVHNILISTTFFRDEGFYGQC